LTLQALGEALETGVATRQDQVLEQVFPDVNVGHTDGINHHVLDACETFC
jgi:hypothetical protein